MSVLFIPSPQESIGFTGTRQGMSERQRRSLIDKLKQLKANFKWLHHGGCVGADYEAACIAHGLGYCIAEHPPSDIKLYHMYYATYRYKDTPYLERNRGIVNCSTFLIAAPSSNQRRLRSGTWACVRYAEKIDKYVHILAR